MFRADLHADSTTRRITCDPFGVGTEIQLAHDTVSKTFGLYDL